MNKRNINSQKILFACIMALAIYCELNGLNVTRFQNSINKCELESVHISQKKEFPIVEALAACTTFKLNICSVFGGGEK